MIHTRIFAYLSERWSQENGYRQVLVIALPLVLSTASWSIQLFVDRMFLTWYSPEAVAAAMPADLINFTLVSLFLGTTGYANTFVAQYQGAGQWKRIGPIVWQGIYVALIGGTVIIMIGAFAEYIFALIGHDTHIQELETVYFQILCLGSTFPIAGAAMSAFFSGQGRTWPVLKVNCLATALNISLNYLFIFGNLGFPELGIKGAGVSTVVSQLAMVGCYIYMLSRDGNNRTYCTLNGWRFEYNLFKRLLRYGLPNGAQLFVDIAGFSAFILLIGRIGTNELIASNIALNVDMLAFMPMVGLYITIATLVGQSLGKNAPGLASKAVFSGLQIAYCYITVLAASMLFAPGIYLIPFEAGANPAAFASIRDVAILAIRFAGACCLFDTLGGIFSAGLKGAGDTRFIMSAIGLISLFCLVLPCSLAVLVFHSGLWVAWVIVCIYMAIISVTFLTRFLGGKWRNMSVIEKTPVIKNLTLDL